ncbi:MAG: histidine kinase [Microbacterium enclense]
MPTGRVVDLMGEPAFALVVFVATVVQVCADPLRALINGAEGWNLPLPPGLVIALAALACLGQALFVVRLGRWPIPSMLGTVACYLFVAVVLGNPAWAVPMQLVIALAMFAVGAGLSPLVASGWSVLAVGGTLASLAWWAAGAGAPAQVVLTFVVTEGTGLVTTSFAGLIFGVLWAAHERRTERARRLAAEAAEREERAVEATRNAERARIAQELHDVAGQHLAGLVSLCDASAELAPAHPQLALDLIDEVRAEGRYAAASLYGALGDLRAVDDDKIATTPDLRMLPEILTFWRERGMDVEFAGEGSLADLPAVVSTTAYRAVQEGLSNAAKHAAGATVRVVSRVTSERLHVAVENDPPKRMRADEAELGLHWGLDGLREKLSLVDGMLQASPDESGGWRLSVVIPLSG